MTVAVLKAGSLQEGVLDVSDVWLWLEDSLPAWPKLLKTALQSKTFLLSFLPFFFPPPFLSSILPPSSFLPLLYPSFPLSSLEVRPILHSLNYPLLLFFSRSVVSESLWPHGLQHARLPCPSLSHQVCLNSCPLSQWCPPTILSTVAPFSSCSQSFPGSRSFPKSCLFASGGQSIGASASATVLPMNIQGWFSLGLTGLISLLSKGLSRVFSSTTVRKHQFFSAQPSLWSNSHICTWLLEKPSLWLYGHLSTKWCLLTLLASYSYFPTYPHRCFSQ